MAVCDFGGHRYDVVRRDGGTPEAEGVGIPVQHGDDGAVVLHHENLVVLRLDLIIKLGKCVRILHEDFVIKSTGAYPFCVRQIMNRQIFQFMLFHAVHLIYMSVFQTFLFS